MSKWPSKSARQKRDRLLSDPEVARWRRRLEKSSPSTSDVWPRRLGAFCLRVGLSPSELLGLGMKRTVDLLDSFEEEERRRGRKGSYVAYTVKVVRSWLRFGGVELPRGAVKVRDADRVFEETALSSDRLRAILNAASAREKVAVSLMAMSGVRPMVLGNYLGMDGLRVRDLPEVRIESREVRFDKLPLRIVVRRDLSKGGHSYTTFIGAEGAGYLKTYLETRLRGGERVGPESPIIVPERAKRTFIRTTNVGDMVRHAIRAAQLDDRPYVLRTTFATRLLTCESQGLVPHAHAQFWMGHRGDMTARYNLNRGQLAEETIEEMREAYKRCEPFLSTIAPADDKEQLRSEFRGMVATMLGLTDDDVKKMDGLTPEQVGEFVRERLRGPAPQPQRIVSVGEAEGLLASGWEATTALSDGRLVVRAPSVTMQDHPRLPTLMRQPGGGE